MSTETLYLTLILVYAILMVLAIVTLERMKQIILRYEQLLRQYGIPHSRREGGVKGFYHE